jgi:hypothetical protein
MSNVSGLIVDSPRIAMNEYFMAKNAAELLHKHYPGHLWATAIDGGFLDIRNLMISGDMGYRVKIGQLFSGSDWDKKVMRAGGEILERYRKRRGVVDEAGIHNLPVNFAGRHTAAM